MKRPLAYVWLVLAARCLPLPLAAALLVGCASLGGPFRPVDPEKDPKVRKAEALREFEEHRDRGQFQAAASRWRQGDVDGARESLQKLLARRPEHIEARLLLAEVLATTDPKAALVQAERVVSEHPDHAEAHRLVTALHEKDIAGRPPSPVRRASASEPLPQAAPQVVNRPNVPAGRQDARPAQPMSAASGAAPVPKPAAKATRIPAYAGPTSDPVVPVVGNAAMNVPAPHRQAKTPTARQRTEGRTGGGVGPIVNIGARAGQANAMGQAEQDLIAGNSAAAKDHLVGIALDPDQDEAAAVAASVLALRYEKPKLAAEVVQSALPRYPRSAALYRTEGVAYYRLGDFGRAKRSLEHALTLDNTHALSYFLLGSVLEKLGQSGPAQENYRLAGQFDARFARAR